MQLDEVLPKSPLPHAFLLEKAPLSTKLAMCEHAFSKLWFHAEAILRAFWDLYKKLAGSSWSTLNAKSPQAVKCLHNFTIMALLQGSSHARLSL